MLTSLAPSENAIELRDLARRTRLLSGKMQREHDRGRLERRAEDLERRASEAEARAD